MEHFLAWTVQNQVEPKAVFFDFFDTLVHRSVHPEYVKQIWAKRLVQYYRMDTSSREIYAMRARLEAQLCIDNEKQGHDLEFQYAQLCQHILATLQQSNTLAIENPNSFTETCLALELAVEKSLQYRSEYTTELLRQLKANNITIGCISDFYLPAGAMQELLHHHGLAQFIDYVFVSSHYLLTKRSGRLYQEVAQQVGMDPSATIMIGDNSHSDVDMAKLQGWQAYWLNRQDKHSWYESHRKTMTGSKHVQTNIENILGNLRQVSQCAPFALTLYLFIERLYKVLRARQLKHVFFLSREGEFLRELFLQYQEQQGLLPGERIEAHYLLASRRATLLPSLQSLDQENFETIFRQYRRISLFDFLSSINMPGEYIDIWAQQLGITAGQCFEDLPTDPIFKRLLTLPSFGEVYEKRRSEQRQALLQYLDDFGTDWRQNGLHIIDVGWKGTIQDHFYRMLAPVPVTGYYMGLVDWGLKAADNEKQGLLFSCCPQRTPHFNIYNANRSLFEVLLGASHGSAAEYRCDGGKVTVETVQETCEEQLYTKIVRPIQERFVRSFGELGCLFSQSHFQCEDFAGLVAKHHASMVYHPTPDELAFFEQLYHVENFGVFEVTRFENTAPIPWKKRWRNLCQFLSNPRAFLAKGYWAPLTLKQHGLDFMIPFYALYGRFRTTKEISQ